MDMNPFAELQQYQLGSSLMGQPQASTPAAQPPVPQLPMGGMPPAAPAQADPAGMEQRTAGWMSALGELQANPAVAVALLQMGTALTGGKKFGTALGMGMGAMGRAGEIENAYAKQGLAEEMLRRKADLEERRFGLDERELAAREAAWGAQAQRYGRMGAGSGGGGGAGTPSESQIAAEVQKLVDAGLPLDIAREAVLRRDYKYSSGRYTTAGSSMSPDDYQRSAARLKDLEALDANVLSTQDPKDPAVIERKQEIARLKAQLFGTQQVGQGAAPAPAGTTATPPVAAPGAPQPAPKPQGTYGQREVRVSDGIDGFYSTIMTKKLQVGDVAILPDGRRSAPIDAAAIARAREWEQQRIKAGQRPSNYNP